MKKDPVQNIIEWLTNATDEEVYNLFEKKKLVEKIDLWSYTEEIIKYNNSNTELDIKLYQFTNGDLVSFTTGFHKDGNRLMSEAAIIMSLVK